MKSLLLRLAAAAACISFIATSAAAPRPPIVALPELTLKSWRFDQLEAMDAVSLGAHVATNLWAAESWSGYALDTRAQGSLLLTPAVTAAYYTNIARTVYRTNFAAGSGTLRLWFAPAWASTTAGGSGPGDWATLFELGQTNAVLNPFAFALAIDPAGTNLVAAVRDELFRDVHHQRRGWPMRQVSSFSNSRMARRNNFNSITKLSATSWARRLFASLEGRDKREKRLVIITAKSPDATLAAQMAAFHQELKKDPEIQIKETEELGSDGSRVVRSGKV